MTFPAAFTDPAMRKRIALIAESFQRLLGRPLVEIQDDPIAALWNAPQAIVAHASGADPIFFFGNKAALAAFETTYDAFSRLPSRLSADPPLRDERQALLDRVSAHGFIDDYAGTRISAKGRCFRIENAVVWNLIDTEGLQHGQAATFSV